MSMAQKRNLAKTERTSDVTRRNTHHKNAQLLPETVGEGALHGEDEYVVVLEEPEVAQHPDPDEEVAAAQEQAAEIPQVAERVPALDQQLNDRPDNDQYIVGADDDIPESQNK